MLQQQQDQELRCSLMLQGLLMTSHSRSSSSSAERPKGPSKPAEATAQLPLQAYSSSSSSSYRVVCAAQAAQLCVQCPALMRTQAEVHLCRQQPVVVQTPLHQPALPLLTLYQTPSRQLWQSLRPWLQLQELQGPHHKP